MTLVSLRKRWRSLCDQAPQWIKILGYAGRDFAIDDGLHWSAAIAYYGVLSIFPLALAVVDIASWFTDPHGASQQVSDILRHVMPHADTVRDIIDKAIANRHRTGLLSILFLLYTGGRAFAVLIRALNVACDTNEIPGFFRRLLLQLAVLFSVGLLFLGALVSNLLVPVLGTVLAPVPYGRETIISLIDWIVPSLFLLGGFFCLYKFVPRHRCNWQSALLGSVAATALCAGAKPLFVVYISRLASYSQVYGWLTIGIIFMVWAEILSVITLYGGELASHIQMIGYDGLTGQEVSRRHRLRSPGRSTEPEPKGIV